MGTLEAEANSDSLEGRPPGPLDAGQVSPRSRPPQPSPLQDLGAGAISARFETALGRLELRHNHLTGRGTFTRQPLQGMGRGSCGVRRHQLASTATPHSRCDRRLLNLRPPLCCCSRHGAGLQSSVRTCLTPPATVLPTTYTFLPCRTLGEHGKQPSNIVQAPTEARLAPSNPTSSDVRHCMPSSHRHAVNWRYRTQTCPRRNRRTRKDDAHA